MSYQYCCQHQFSEYTPYPPGQFITTLYSLHGFIDDHLLYKILLWSITLLLFVVTSGDFEFTSLIGSILHFAFVSCFRSAPLPERSIPFSEFVQIYFSWIHRHLGWFSLRFLFIPEAFSLPCFFMDFVFLFLAFLHWRLFSNFLLISSNLASCARRFSPSGVGDSHQSFVFNILYQFASLNINPSAVSCSLPYYHPSRLSPIYFT